MNRLFTRSKKWMSIVLAAVLLLSLVVPLNASATTTPVSLAKWDFSKANLVATSGIDANLNKELSTIGATIKSTWVSGPNGVNVPSAENWTNEPAFWKVSLSTKGYQNITLSSKQRSSSTGPKDFKVQYSLDGSTWIDVTTVTVADNWTSGVLTNVALPSEANDLDTVQVRWLRTTTITSTTGTNRIGEIEFKGEEAQTTPQPDPGATPGKGTVVLGEHALANLTFSLMNVETQQWYDFTSDENGVFTFDFPDGTYKVEGLWVSPKWYVLGQTFTITNGLVDGLHELKIDGLNPPAGIYNVTGFVKNGTQALPQLIFSLHDTAGNWFDAATDQNGKFNFKLADGDYQIDGIWDNAASKWYELNQTFKVISGKLAVGNELLIDVAAAADNVTGTLKKGATPFNNTVFSLHTSSGAEKWFDTKTDANGNFSFKLPNGSYTIDGIWDSAAGKWYELKKNFTVNGALQLNIDVLTDGTGVVSPNLTGVVKKGTETLSDVIFSVHTKTDGDAVWYDMTTDANGVYSTTVPNGTYVLEGIWLNTESKWYELKKEFTVSGVTELNVNVLDAVANEKFTLDIMHTNDTHANVDNTTNKINVAKKMTAINTFRADHPNALLLDAGDVFSGTLYFNEYKGMADLEFMELAGYDAMTFGNHEFDLGTGVLGPFVKAADFPFVSANVDFSNDANLKDVYNGGVTTASPAGGQIYNGIIKVVNGEKIGIFGLTTEETPTISSPGDVTFKNYIAEATRSVADLKAKGVNKIIALTHIGFDDSLAWDNDMELAKQVEGIDVIVGGHTHTKLSAPVFDTTGDEPTVIVQANEYNKFLGTLDVTFDGAGKVLVPETTGQLLDISTFAEDAATLQILNTKYKPAVSAKEQTVVGVAGVQLVGGNPPARTGETNLGNFIADGMLAKAKTINPETVIAVQNGGGIRVTLPAGNITLADVFKVLPFGNTLGIMNLKGSELKEALEYSVKDAPTTAFGGFLQVSGLKFTYDSTKPAGSKVQTIDVKNADGTYKPLDVTKNYYVATNIFTAKGGDGFTMFGKAYVEGRVSEPGFVDWEMFNDFIAAQPNQTVNAQVEGRIINVAPQNVPAASFSGTQSSPKVYYGNVVVDVTGVSKLEYAVVKGNLTLKGNTGVQLNNVTVEGETFFVD